MKIDNVTVGLSFDGSGVEEIYSIINEIQKQQQAVNVLNDTIKKQIILLESLVNKIKAKGELNDN